MVITIVTTNAGKFEEISHVLGVETKQASFSEDEVGSTLEEIATNKALAAWNHFHQPLVVDDTGHFFTALDNFPGVRPKYWFQQLGYEGILKRLEGKDRRAYFKTVIAYITSPEDVHLFDGTLWGKIVEKPVGEARTSLPYDRLFMPDGEEKVMADLTLDRIAELSHRAQAARKLAAFLRT